MVASLEPLEGFDGTGHGVAMLEHGAWVCGELGLVAGNGFRDRQQGACGCSGLAGACQGQAFDAFDFLLEQPEVVVVFDAVAEVFPAKRGNGPLEQGRARDIGIAAGG